MDHVELRREIVQTCRRMRASGLAAATEGNVCARSTEGNVLITPSGLDYAVTEPEDIVVVSLNGKRLEGAFEPVVLSADEMAEVAAKIHDYGQSKPLEVRDN